MNITILQSSMQKFTILPFIGINSPIFPAQQEIENTQSSYEHRLWLCHSRPHYSAASYSCLIMLASKVKTGLKWFQ